MYPRNAESPEPIAIGAVLLIADGTVQTSGVTVRVKPIGVSEANGAGTVAYSTNGIVIYTPTQAETNYTSFVVIATKTSCIPVSINVVTTASEIAGTVSLNNVNGTVVDGPDDFKADVSTFDSSLTGINDQITNIVTQLNQLPNVEAVTNKLDTMLVLDGSVYQWTADSLELIDKTGYSLTAITGLGNQTANITGNLSGSVGSVTGAVGSVTGAVGSVTGNVGGNVTGSVGSVLGNVAGSVNSVTSAVTVGFINAGVITATSIAAGAFTSAKFAAGAFDAVWSVAARTLTTVADSSGVTTLLSRIGSVLTISSGKVTVGTNDDKTGYGLAADQAVNVTKVGGTTVAGPNDLKADVSGLSTFDPTIDSVALQPDQVVNTTGLATSMEVGQIGDNLYTWLIMERISVNVAEVNGVGVSGPDDFKADVSGLSTFDSATDQVIVPPYYTPDEIVRGIITGTVPNGSLARFVRDIQMADVLFEGQIVTATTQTATLDAGATSVCFGQAITIGEEGDVDRQTRFIVGFDPATKVITLDMPWCVIPPNGRDYSVKVLRNALAGDLDKSRAGSYGAGIADTNADIQTLSSKFAGITLIRNWLAVIMGKTSDAPTLAEVNVTTAANNYNNVTDSQEAIRDRGDAAWTGGDYAATIYTYFTDGTRANAFKADVSGLSTFDATTDQVIVDKTGYSLTPTTGLGNQTANITGNLTGSVGSVTGAVGNVTGNVGGNVSGSVGSVLGNVVGSVASVTSPVTVGTNNDKSGYSLSQAFPSNFASLGINASGHVSRVSLVDTTTVNTDMRGTNNAMLAASYTAPANSDIAAIKTKTDQFVFTVANQVDSNALTGGASAAANYAYFTDGTRANAFKADVSGLSTLDTKIDTVIDDTQNILTGIDEFATAVDLMNSKLSSSTINIISPLNSDGTTLSVIQGDDYLTVDNRNILFTGDVTDQWMDLTDATVIIGIYGTSINKECVVISATGMQQISLQLTSSDTNIPQGTYDYDVQATLNNGSIITLFRGKFTCSKSYTN